MYDGPRLRLAIVGVVAVSLFAALLARLWYLQVLSAPELKLAAEQNQVRVVKEPAPRGRILDRHGNVIVDNRASNVVAMDRTQLSDEERPAVLARLAELLSLPVEQLSRRLDDPTVSPYTPVPLAEDVDERLMVRLMERQDELEGVVTRRVAVRSYPHGNLAAHVVGYVGEINDRELAANEGDYDLGDNIGKAGVERIYERDLRGIDGELRIEVDAKGRPIRTLERTPPVQGHDIVLSIDMSVQRVAEEQLAAGILAARGRTFEDDGRPLVANAGSVVVLDAKEGTVTAMASYPTFDLPGLADGISGPEAEALFSEGTGAPFINRAIQGEYAPGSTWKLVVADAALRSGLITPSSTYDDRGSFLIEDCAGDCDRRNARGKAYGHVDIRRALTVSSDVFFYSLGSRFWQQRRTYGEDAIQRSAAMLGLDGPTGVPLPDEKDGRLASPALREQLHADNPRAWPNDGWFEGDNVNLAIGQAELTLTPMQIANAYATYAAGGVRHEPNIALRLQRQDGTLVRAITPRVKAQVDLPPHVRDPIARGLERVVSDPEGTAYHAFRGFPLGQWGIAGKTGTAQATPKQDTALFAAWGPTFDPRHVITVVMEQAGFGSTAAAPVARRLFGVLSQLELDGPVAVAPVPAPVD